jgi:hypothetical protein
LLGWIRETNGRLLQEQEKVQQLTQQLSVIQSQLAQERTRRAIAEERLSAAEGHRTLREIALAGGVAMFGFAVEHWGLGAPAYLLATVGAALVGAAVLPRFLKK